MLEDREYYESEKEDFANSLNYYGEKHGEAYGWTLAEPYSESEILEFETINNIRIPEELRYYLTVISRETVNHKAYIIELKIDTITYINEEGYECNYACNHINHKDDLNKKGCEKNYFMRINERGCAKSDYICVKGNWYGGIGNCDTLIGNFKVIYEDLENCLN